MLLGVHAGEVFRAKARRGHRLALIEQVRQPAEAPAYALTMPWPYELWTEQLPALEAV